MALITLRPGIETPVFPPERDACYPQYSGLHLILELVEHSYRTFPLTFRKYLVILSISLFGSVGDAFLARGMRDAGSIDIRHITHILAVLANPFVVTGIVFLLAFMYCYMTALSFADLSYVMPATALGYVNMVLLSIFWLHERVSLQRWGGVALIVFGVGLVAGGPSRTEHPHPAVSEPEAVEEHA